jgi:hypothetical protein
MPFSPPKPSTNPLTPSNTFDNPLVKSIKNLSFSKLS